MNTLSRLWQEDDGQDVVEYALIGGLVSIVAYSAISAAGGSVNTIWTNISSDLAAATT